MIRYNTICGIGSLPDTEDGVYNLVVHQDEMQFQAIMQDRNDGSLLWEGPMRDHATEALSDSWVHATKAGPGRTFTASGEEH